MFSTNNHRFILICFTGAEIVLSFSLEKDQLSGDEFLLLKDLPLEFEDRYGSIPPRIYIRRCYKQLYDITADNMSSRAMEWGITLYTGVPGIGKSLFLIYFIYRFLHDDRFPDKRFVLEFQDSFQEYLLFEPALLEANVFTCSRRAANSIRNKDFLVLCDINKPTEPASRAKWLLIFSSPDPARYKEVMKNGPSFRYTLPTWSEPELTSCDKRVQLWYDNFVRFGGVPRYVLPRSHAADQQLLLLLESAVSQKGGLIITEFFKFGFNTIDLIQNYLLVHINPPPFVSASYSDIDSDFQYDGIPNYSFASDHVFQLLVSKYGTMMLAIFSVVFNVGVATSAYGAVSAGHLFEKVCLWLKPLESQQFTAAALLGRAGSEEFIVPSSRELLPHDWKRASLLRPNIHYLPRISNLESGDSFYLTETSVVGEYLLVVIQITISAEHKVKANGLSEVVKAFQDSSSMCNITQKALVFVVPKHGSLSTEQAIVTQKGKVMAESSIPLYVRDFKQYVYRREI